MNLPTWITISRLAGIPVILVLLQQPTPAAQWWSLAIFLAVAATDWLDGYLARRLNQVTDLGKFLDPLVDKLLVLCVLLALIELGRVPAWGVSIILARELAIAGWRVSQPKISGANIWGKLKTVSQIGAIALLVSPLPPLGSAIATVAFWVSVAFTVVSGVLYVMPQAASSGDSGESSGASAET
ncbi:MAG: CDP-diacylglycerol--glycerol-3-phosphate 3-phosphatidyltransferase [Elainellaceae cyanobacterium]